MYRPRSFYSELGDIEIIEYNKQLHMFHLTIGNRDLVGHAVSDDGLSWEALPPAIRTGDPGDCDDDMIRTMSVTEFEQKFYMLYTATSRKEGGRIERTALATSTDLMTWEKHIENPVAAPQADIYESKLENKMFVSWRDPKPYYEDGVFYCVNCSRENKGPFIRRGSVLLMTSKNLIDWELKPPILAPTQYYDVECPQLLKMGNYYYIIGSIMEDRTQRYWVSENIDGPYLTPGNNKLMPPESHYAGRITMFNGKYIFGCWNNSVEDGPSPYELLAFTGHPVRYVPSPLEVCQDGNGRLFLAPYSGWDTYKTEIYTGLTDDCSLLNKNRTSRIDVENNKLFVEEGFEIAAFNKNVEHIQLEGNLRLNAAKGGIAFHLDQDGGGYFIEFSPEEDKVSLIKHFKSIKHPEQIDWFEYENRQENHFKLNDLGSKGIDFVLRAVNGEIEFSINNRVIISTVSTAKTKGKIGIFAESGVIQLCELSVTKMKVPFNK